jgi:hypothetical protein
MFSVTGAEIARPHQAWRPGASAQLSFHGRAEARSEPRFARLIEPDDPSWWSQTGSNRRPPACKAGALPTELWPLQGIVVWLELVGLGRLELPTSRLSSARSNQLSYKPGSRGPTDRPPGIRMRILDPKHPEDAAARGSSAKKEKRRRRCPASGCAHPENERILMFPRDPIEDA